MTEQPAGGDVAIIGMSCLFPGSDGRDAFWNTIVSRRVCLGQPLPEWGADRHIADDRIYTTTGGFLRDLYRFDPVELGVMPSSIDGSEPDQFLALRMAREALLDAGYLDNPGDRHARTGIVLGHSTYLHRGNASVVQHGVVIDQTVALVQQLMPEVDAVFAERMRSILHDKLPAFNADTAPGLVPNVMTGRIANRLDLKGPNYTIDAACASSLLSVGTAIDELRAGRSDMMLAGGVNAAIPAEVYMVFSQLGALSRQGAVRTFDAETDGTLLGEGLGVLVLKRTQDAVRDGDRIYATVRGVGQSSDGKAFGLLAPRLEGEILAFERAYDYAGVDPATVGLIEAHGTGIPKGDETEIAALRSVFGDRAGALPTAGIGSVKSLIGHCIPAAGAAGLIKSALALHYRVLPPTICETVNPSLGIEETPIYVNTRTRPWIHGAETPRRAAVNAFGFGGVNSHAVLEDAPGAAEARQPTWPYELVSFCAPDREGLVARVQSLLTAHDDGTIGDARLAEIAAAAAAGGSGPYRLSLVASDIADAVSKLEKALKKIADPACSRIQSRNGTFFETQQQPGKLAFVFPGEGAQYRDMLDDVLMAFPEARPHSGKA